MKRKPRGVCGERIQLTASTIAKLRWWQVAVWFDVVHERSDRLTGSSRIGGDIYQYLLIEEIEQVAAMIDCQPREGRDRRDAYAESLAPQRRIIIGCTIAALAAVVVMVLLIDGLSGHWEDIYRDALRSSRS